MKTLNKSILLAMILGAASFGASADDLIGTVGKGKAGRTTVALDLITGGESSVFEFVVEVPAGATKVDISKCLKTLPSTHTGECRYNEKTREVIGVAYSQSASLLPKGAVELGTVTFVDTLAKQSNGVKIRDLQVGTRTGTAIPSNIQVEDALLGK